MKTKKEFFNYLENSTSWSVVSKRLDLKLPLYIKLGYDLWNAEISGFGILFLVVKNKSIDMRMHYNARKKIEDIYSGHVVFVFDSIEARTLNSLVKKHIPFVVPDKQIFLPFALLQIQTDNKVTLKRNDKLSTDADTILIGYLDGVIHDSMIISDIAKSINRELRATSKALEILEKLHYLRIEKQGKRKVVFFISKYNVYEKLNNELITPLEYTLYVKEEFTNNFVYSGYSALSKYSSLMDSDIKTIAIHSKKLKEIDLTGIECEEDIAKFKVEVWNRDPTLFSHNNSVNKLYILRLMKNIDDERTEYALEEIERNIQKKLRG